MVIQMEKKHNIFVIWHKSDFIIVSNLVRIPNQFLQFSLSAAFINPDLDLLFLPLF